MQKWLTPAIEYIPRWLEFQMRVSQQPGCIIAVAHRNRVVLERAFGLADLEKGHGAHASTPLPHRFAFQELHGSGCHEAARARQAQARR